MNTGAGLSIGPRLSLMASTLALAAAAIGCSATNPSVQPSGTVGQGPTPTDLASTLPTSTLPTSTPDAAGSPLGGCPGPQPGLAAILAIDPGQRLACFGRSTVTFQAAAVATEVDCVPVQVEPAWLWCPPAAFLAPPGTADSRPGADSGAWATGSAPTDDRLILAFAANVPMLEVYAAPGSGVDPAQFFPGAIVQVTGHFDDPAATACRVVAAQPEPGWQVPTPAEVVLACREAFVVTSVQPGSA